MEVNGPGKTPRPNTLPTMRHGSDRARDVGKQAMASNKGNMESLATEKSLHDWHPANKESDSGTKKTYAVSTKVFR